MTEDAKAKIQEMTQNNDIVLFMKGTPEMPVCGFSARAVSCFDHVGVKPEQIHGFNILENRDLVPVINELSDWPTYPQIYVKGEFIGGGDILFEMTQEGELEALLKDKGVIAA